MQSLTTTPRIQSTVRRLTCEHCEHIGRDVSAKINRADHNSEMVLCDDWRACLARQLAPAAECAA